MIFTVTKDASGARLDNKLHAKARNQFTDVVGCQWRSTFPYALFLPSHAYGDPSKAMVATATLQGQMSQRQRLFTCSHFCWLGLDRLDSHNDNHQLERGHNQSLRITIISSLLSDFIIEVMVKMIDESHKEMPNRRFVFVTTGVLSSSLQSRSGQSCGGFFPWSNHA